MISFSYFSDSRNSNEVILVMNGIKLDEKMPLLPQYDVYNVTGIDCSIGWSLGSFVGKELLSQSSIKMFLTLDCRIISIGTIVYAQFQRAKGIAEGVT